MTTTVAPVDLADPQLYSRGIPHGACELVILQIAYIELIGWKIKEKKEGGETSALAVACVYAFDARAMTHVMETRSNFSTAGEKVRERGPRKTVNQSVTHGGFIVTVPSMVNAL